MIEFHAMQLKTMKSVMETDLWQRLPLPEHYEYVLPMSLAYLSFRLPELKVFMPDYPHTKRELLTSLTVRPRPGSDKSVPPWNSLKRVSNPFEAEYRLVTTKPGLMAQERLPASPSKSPTSALRPAQEAGTPEEDLLENVDEGETGAGIAAVRTLSSHQTKPGRRLMICSPGLNLVKAMSKYVELMYIVTPCPDLILDRMQVLYKFYIRSVFVLFIPPLLHPAFKIAYTVPTLPTTMAGSPASNPALSLTSGSIATGAVSEVERAYTEQQLSSTSTFQIM